MLKVPYLPQKNKIIFLFAEITHLIQYQFTAEDSLSIFKCCLLHLYCSDVAQFQPWWAYQSPTLSIEDLYY